MRTLSLSQALCGTVERQTRCITQRAQSGLSQRNLATRCAVVGVAYVDLRVLAARLTQVKLV